MGNAAPDAHLRDELGLAEGTHVAGQHRWAAQQGPRPARVVGGDLRVDHLLDLREENRAQRVREDLPATIASARRGSDEVQADEEGGRLHCKLRFPRPG